MNLDKSQLYHIESRIWHIKRDLASALEKRKDAEIQASFKDEKDFKVTLFQSGKAKIKSKIESANCLADVFDLPKNWDKQWKDAREKICSKYETIEKTLENKVTELWDELILGDQEKALRMLREFEQFKP